MQYPTPSGSEKIPTDQTEASADTEGGKTLPFNEQTNYVSLRKIITIFLACASVDMVALIDQTTLSVSLSIIATALSAGTQSSWIANAYFITSTSTQLLYSRLSDIWSRKIVLLCALFVFFVGSLAASLAQTAAQLIAFRAITGIGGGGLATLGQIILSDVVTLRERGKYQGILGVVVALSNGVGPVIGGALASQSENSWRWIFRLSLPLSAISTLCVIFLMPLRKVEGSWKKKIQAVDFLGAFLTLGASTLMIVGFTWAGSDYPWDSAHVIATLVAGFFTFVLFALWQWKGTKNPLMPLHIFKNRMVIGACLSMSCNGWNSLVQIYYITRFYQLAYGYSATKSGALLLPLTIIQTFSSTLSGLFVTWCGRYRGTLLLGWAVWAAGLGLFSTLDENSGLGKQIGYGLLTGFGVGQTLQPSLVAIQAGVERKDMAVVTGTRNFMRNLGGSLGLAIAGTIINNTLRLRLLPLGFSSTEIREILDAPAKAVNDSHSAEVRSAYFRGFRYIFILGAALAAFSFFVVFFLMPEITLDRADDAKLKAEARSRSGLSSATKETAAEEATTTGNESN